MHKNEYLKAVKKARILFAYVAITKERGKVPSKISKASAARLVKLLSEDAQIDAMWADPSIQEVLLIG